jgi:hypothetical protein
MNEGTLLKNKGEKFPPALLRRKGHTPLRTLLFKVLLLGGSIVFALLVIEVALRLLGKDEALVWQPDARLGWHHVPGARRHWTEEGDGLLEINTLGYRDRHREIAKRADSFRIGIFGDSMTEGVQVNLEDTFCYLLEEKLRQSGFPVEVFNFGISNYSPIQEYLLFKRESLRFNLDVVILALFLDNDVSDCHPSLARGGDGAPFVSFRNGAASFDYSRPEESYANYHRAGLHFIRTYSAIYRLLRNWHKAHARRAVEAAQRDAIPQRYRLYQNELEPDWEEAWSTVEQLLLLFAGTAKSVKKPFVVLSIPAGQVVNEEAWRNILRHHPLMKHEAWDLDGPDRRLRAFAERHDMLLLQPYPVFRSEPRFNTLHFGDVGHLTVHGHRLIAETIEGFLHHNHLLPGNRSAQDANYSKSL